jgi:glutamate N-acetyltransferase / amino-acid N-acetyltransferase
VSVTAASGFRASGVTAGLKPSGARDVALVVNDGPAYAAAAVFTTNRCKAHPVLWSEQVMRDGTLHAVMTNSGGANCYTGPDGFAATHATAEQVADLLGIGAVDVAVCSTGLIGVRLDRDKLTDGVDKAYRALGEAGGSDAAEAIRTTDSVRKEAVVGRSGYTIGGMAKGAGMLAPALATMLVTITTDADVDASGLDTALRAATARTFDRLDSDGCMSTNDTVLLMASGASEIRPAADDFAHAVHAVCHDLAQQLLSDAEGSSHDIAITVNNAASETNALEVARSVSRSNLFKCAIFGNDPNWGRVLAQVGTTSAMFDPHDLDIAINDVWVCRCSRPGDSVDLVDLTPRAVTVIIDLKVGDAEATIWTNDLTTVYVHENSAYST